MNKINEIQNKINKLPKGYISKKQINGKYQYYLQWNQFGKKKSKYISLSNLDLIKEQIKQRKQLEDELKQLIGSNVSIVNDNKLMYFNCNVIYGYELKEFVDDVKGYKKRNIYNQINEYLNIESNKVLILYGLRRTGKTTLIKQTIFNMNENDLNKTCFIQISNKDELVNLNKDIKLLKDNGYKYIFINEVTLLNDFIDGAALFSDIYTSNNTKIILSGTDSLGFMIARSNQLYDRCFLIHTTFIPYKEFENILGIKGIDNYIQYGGTMSISGKHYNNSIFASSSSIDEYIDSSIANNIQHSLKNYQNENHFRSLYDLYTNDELTSAINRIIEDINHRFTIEILDKDFKSNDLALSQRNLRKESDILDNIDANDVTQRLKHLLQIKNKNERKITINENHVLQIQEYLKLLEMIDYIDVEYIPVKNDKTTRTIFTQPGIRYYQCQALINSLMKDKEFSNIDVHNRNYIISRIENEIKGRMMEDIILLETKYAKNDKKVFKLQFAIGEIDMVVVDEKQLTVDIYEIKHSDKIVERQMHFINDNELLEKTSHRYGTIVSKNVIYNGISQKYQDINYINVEEYLNNLF